MKTLTTITLGLFLLVGCTVKTDRQPKYSDFENDLERNNLFGKVKEVIQYKANYIEPTSNKTETPIIELKTEYTTFGKISNLENYYNLGKLQQRTSSEYNDKKQIVKSQSEFFIQPNKTISTFEYDNSGNAILSMLISGTEEIKIKMEYDSLKNLTKQVSFSKQDTNSNTFSYTYNKKGKVLAKRQIQISQKDTLIYLNDFKYNSTNNLICINSNSKLLGEMSTKHDYNNGVLIKTTHYKNGKLLDETLYDKYHNPISVKKYLNDLLVSEFRNSYKFDREGNWTVKIVEINDGGSSNTKFTLLYEETREIRYY